MNLEFRSFVISELGVLMSALRSAHFLLWASSSKDPTVSIYANGVGVCHHF